MNEIQDMGALSHEEKLLLEEEYNGIRKTLSFLSKRHREVLVLYYIEEKSYKQISGELSIPLSSVKWRLNEAKNVMKKELEKVSEYMNNGYRKAKDLHIEIGYTSKHQLFKKSERAMDNLLSKNIAILCYDNLLNISEISSQLGVATDYIEDSIDRMLSGYCLERTGDRYLTNFPIFSEEINEKIKALITKVSEKYFDELKEIYYSAAKAIKSIIPGGEQITDKQLISIVFRLKDFAQPQKNPFEEQFDFPYEENGDKWIVIGYDFERAVSFPMNLMQAYQQEETINGIEKAMMCFCNEDDELWKLNKASYQILGRLVDKDDISDIADYENEIEYLLDKKIILKSDNGYELNVLIINDDQYRNVVSLLSPIAEKNYDILKKVKPNIIREASSYFPRNLKHINEYVQNIVLCEYINSFEHYLINNNMIESVPFIHRFSRNIDNQQSGYKSMY